MVAIVTDQHGRVDQVEKRNTSKFTNTQQQQNQQKRANKQKQYHILKENLLYRCLKCFLYESALYVICLWVIILSKVGLNLLQNFCSLKTNKQKHTSIIPQLGNRPNFDSHSKSEYYFWLSSGSACIHVLDLFNHCWVKACNTRNRYNVKRLLTPIFGPARQQTKTSM